MQKTCGDVETFAGMTAVVLRIHNTKWVGNTNENPCAALIRTKMLIYELETHGAFLQLWMGAN